MKIQAIVIEDTSIMYDVEYGKFYYRIEIQDSDQNLKIVLYSKTKPKVVWK